MGEYVEGQGKNGAFLKRRKMDNSNLEPHSHQEPSVLNVGEQDLMEVAQKESNLEPHSHQEPSVLNTLTFHF